MLTEKDYCDYDTCVALNELGLSFEDASQGFERNILTNRYEEVPRPLLYEAQKWLREKEIYVSVIPEYNELGPVKGVKYRLEVAHWKDDDFGYETIEWLDEEEPHVVCCFDSYEEALLEGVKAAVKLLKK